MAYRVVWGRLLTMPTFSPTRALVSVVLPALGRPTRATKPLRCGVCSGLLTAPVSHPVPTSPPPARRPPWRPLVIRSPDHNGSWLSVDGEPGPLMIRSPDHQGVHTVVRSAPSGPARCTGADGVRSRTAASPSGS